jgi:hypothetical protein
VARRLRLQRPWYPAGIARSQEDWTMDLEIFGYGGIVALIIAIALAVVIYNLLTGREV